MVALNQEYMKASFTPLVSPNLHDNSWPLVVYRSTFRLSRKYAPLFFHRAAPCRRTERNLVECAMSETDSRYRRTVMPRLRYREYQVNPKTDYCDLLCQYGKLEHFSKLQTTKNLSVSSSIWLISGRTLLLSRRRRETVAYSDGLRRMIPSSGPDSLRMRLSSGNGADLEIAFQRTMLFFYSLS